MYVHRLLSPDIRSVMLVYTSNTSDPYSVSVSEPSSSDLSQFGGNSPFSR